MYGSNLYACSMGGLCWGKEFNLNGGESWTEDWLPDCLIVSVHTLKWVLSITTYAARVVLLILNNKPRILFHLSLIHPFHSANEFYCHIIKRQRLNCMRIIYWSETVGWIDCKHSIWIAAGGFGKPLSGILISECTHFL